MAISLGSGNNKIQILCTGHLGAKRSIGGSELLRRGEGNEWCALEESGCGGDGEFEEWHAVLLTAVRRLACPRELTQSAHLSPRRWVRTCLLYTSDAADDPRVV